MPYFLRRIWNPAIYQGGNTNRQYFEGWYFKQSDASGKHVLAVIPGVSYSLDGSSNHAFVQVFAGNQYTHYFSYPIESFSFDPDKPFNARIGENIFTEEGMSLRLKDADTEVTGDIVFGHWSPWPVTAFSPGIMGWYRFVPAMETYHGVLSMDHEVSGRVSIDGMPIVMDGGRGYIEKDWGRGFPSAWIWAQSNHFDEPGTSISASIATIPWMGRSFTGSIVGLLHKGKLHRFATYTGAKLVHVSTVDEEAHVVLRDKHEEIEIMLHGCNAQALKAPVLGSMAGHAAESLGGTIAVALRDVSGGQSRLLFEGTGSLAGIEVMNTNNELEA